MSAPSGGRRPPVFIGEEDGGTIEGSATFIPSDGTTPAEILSPPRFSELSFVGGEGKLTESLPSLDTRLRLELSNTCAGDFFFFGDRGGERVGTGGGGNELKVNPLVDISPGEWDVRGVRGDPSDPNGDARSGGEEPGRGDEAGERVTGEAWENAEGEWDGVVCKWNS
jgi:hypothetical protein